MTRDLASDVNENLRTAFGTLADEIPTSESRQFGPVTAVCAGVPAPIFNRVFVFDPPPIDELSAAVAWMSEREVPFWLTVSEPAVEKVTNHLADLGLETATEQPGMAMASLDEIPTPDTSVDIVEVTDPDEREDFSAVTASAFEMSLDVAAKVDRAGFAADDVRTFLGSVDGHPAGCGVLIRSGDVAGIYSIGVVEEFRRQGIGEEMSWAVLRAGRDAGCRVGVLQSSEMGYPLYEEMGFQMVVTYHLFEPAE